MAQFIPSLEIISKFRVQPTEGECSLLRFLERSLDDTFEVYFNPFLNGDRPDVVIMRILKMTKKLMLISNHQ